MQDNTNENDLVREVREAAREQESNAEILEQSKDQEPQSLDTNKEHVNFQEQAREEPSLER